MLGCVSGHWLILWAGLRTLKRVSVISRQEEERKVSVVLQMKTEQELYRVKGHSDHHLKLFNLSICRMYLDVSLILASKLLEKSHRKLQQLYSCSQIWHLGVKGASAHPSV